VQLGVDPFQQSSRLHRLINQLRQGLRGLELLQRFDTKAMDQLAAHQQRFRLTALLFSLLNPLDKLALTRCNRWER